MFDSIGNPVFKKWMKSLGQDAVDTDLFKSPKIIIKKKLKNLDELFKYLADDCKNIKEEIVLEGI